MSSFYTTADLDWLREHFEDFGDAQPTSDVWRNTCSCLRQLPENAVQELAEAGIPLVSGRAKVLMDWRLANGFGR